MGKTQTEDMDYCAVSIVGPRNRVDKIVGKLPLMPWARIKSAAARAFPFSTPGIEGSPP
ncbi:DUF2000 family protein [Streptomyces sp. NPDC055722]